MVVVLLLLLLVVVLVVRVEGVDEGESIVDEGSGVLLAITPAGGRVPSPETRRGAIRCRGR